MKFAIYQIQLTEAQRNTVNETGDFNSVPAMAVKVRMDMDFAGNKIGGLASDAFEAGHYTHVANIEAIDLNEVFEIGNIGPESAIERLAPMSSVSVGDMIIDEEGDTFVVAPMGFVGVGVNKLLAA